MTPSLRYCVTPHLLLLPAHGELLWHVLVRALLLSHAIDELVLFLEGQLGDLANVCRHGLRREGSRRRKDTTGNARQQQQQQQNKHAEINDTEPYRAEGGRKKRKGEEKTAKCILGRKFEGGQKLHAGRGGGRWT